MPVLATVLVALLAPAAHATVLRTVASGLDQPKKLTLTPAGDLLVALSGNGRAPASCTDGEQRSCLNRSGAIDRVTPAGRITRLISDLPSVSLGPKDPQATGPIEAVQTAGGLHVLFQDLDIDIRSGRERFGREGSLLGTLTDFTASGTARLEASLGPFEARHNPDDGRGTDVAYGEDAAIGSDPYGIVGYRGGWAIADAGANDVLWVSPTGRVHVLAVLPTIRERAAAGTYGSSQTSAIQAEAQAVPTGIAVGPHGDLYVGELGGIPYARGASTIYRIVPGHRPIVDARGFTAIDEITFDREGRLLVLELDRHGLDDPGLADGDPTSGALYLVGRDGRRRLLAARGLSLPTGLAVTRSGVIYIADHGLSRHGTIVSLREPR